MRLFHIIYRYRLRLTMAFIIASFYVSGMAIFYLSGGSPRRTLSRDDIYGVGTVQDVFPRDVINSRQDMNIYQALDIPKKYPHLKNRTYVKTCSEHKHFVFIKGMKCATETMGTILRRFGLVRNLSFVVPEGTKLYLGWPFPMTSKDYRPSKTGEYNILVDHAIYNRPFMRSIMPNNTKYITIIRQPYNHFKSVFNYFNIANVAKVPGPDTMSEYLHNLEKYETLYKSHEASPIRYCVPDNFSLTRNLLSHCLGMPLGFPSGTTDITNEPDAVQEYINDLDKEFSLVMILEYFSESLVLLRRLMCWTIKDVLYHSVNGQNYRYKKSKPKPENVEIYSKWSLLDYQLYAHFNRTFWLKVQAQEDDFMGEVQFFKNTQTKMESFCFGAGRNSTLSSLQISASPWSNAFEFTRKGDCRLLEMHLFNEIKKQYDKL